MENTMLIVDDYKMNREILKLLFHENYGIIEAEDGKEALDILERCQGNIDIILLDLLMPEVSGIEVLKTIKSNDELSGIPVVVITSSSDMEDQIKAFEMGASDFINKPFIPEIVVSRVTNVMASHRRMLSVELEARKLKIKSELDEMTGIYNKTTASLMANEILSSAANQLNALLVIDIDNFKAVNDTSGHLAGDHVIKIISDLISSLFRKTDVVGRIGGDEFMVLMNDIPSVEVARAKVNELIQVMRYKPNLTIPEYVTLSIGVATNYGHPTTFDDLFHKADEALYLAKKGGKAQYREFGVEPVNLSEDKRSAVLLISNNRSVCSVVTAVIPSKLRIIEALDLTKLDTIDENEAKKIIMTYADVSDLEVTAEYWEKLKSYSWLKMDKVYAICEEGNISQYMETLKHGVADMLTTPIDTEAFKRRVLKQLEKFNIE